MLYPGSTRGTGTMLEGILSHYADDIVFQAATVRRWNKPDGVLRGTAELRAHFTKGLELAPNLYFEFEEIFQSGGICRALSTQ
jgi:hypothetical protein